MSSSCSFAINRGSTPFCSILKADMDETNGGISTKDKRICQLCDIIHVHTYVIDYSKVMSLKKSMLL